MAKNKNFAPQSYIFQVTDSITILLVTFLVAVFFAVLLCFYPGKEFLGSNFWPLIALPGALALGTVFKLLTRKPILQIDGKGIYFFRSKALLPWKIIHTAQVMTLESASQDPEDYLVIKYLHPQTNELLQTDFLIKGTMNKTSAQIEAAVEFFRK